MKKQANNKTVKKNPSKATEKDIRNLEMSLKDEADGFYHFEDSIDEYIED